MKKGRSFSLGRGGVSLVTQDIVWRQIRSLKNSQNQQLKRKKQLAHDKRDTFCFVFRHHWCVKKKKKMKNRL